MKKVLSIILVVLLLLSMLFPIVANASENNGHGNEWVYDEPQVISDETEAYIKNLNENVFAGYANKPQLAIMIINNLPYNMTQYKLDTFNDYGVGTAEENCGMLFIFALNDREYGLEIGDGFVEGSLIRADLETDFVTEEMKSYLKSKDYDTAIMMIVQYLEKLMADQENGVYAQKEAEKLAADKAAANAVIEKINRIGVVEYEDASIKRVNDAKSAYKKLTKTQKQLVYNYDVLVAASDTLDTLRHENNMRILKFVGLGICVAGAIAGLIALLVAFIKKTLANQKVEEMLSRCSHILSVSRLSDVDVRSAIKANVSEYSAKCVESEFIDIIYKLYIKKQSAIIGNLPNMLCEYDDYVAELRKVNTLRAFENCRLTDVAIIVANVDDRQRKKDELREANTKKVNDFLNANRHRVADDEIWIELRKLMHNSFDNHSVEVREDQLDKYFTEKLNELGFKKEFDKFVNANKDSIGRDFNKSKLYSEMCATNNYRGYHYGMRMDRVWMMHMLMSHQKRQKQDRLEQAKREQEAAERRRREAQRRAQQQSISNRNSSFGSSFGGGRSSGGGMRGGW